MAVGVEAGCGRSEGFDVIDEFVVLASDPLILKSLADSGGEGGEFVEVVEADRWSLVLDEEKPITSPGDLAGDGAVIGDFNLLFCNQTIARNIGNSDGTIG